MYFLKSSKIFLIYLDVPILGASMFVRVMFSLQILPLSIMKCPSVSPFMAFCFEIYFVWCKYCNPGFFFSVHFLGTFHSNPSLSACVGLLFSCGSLLGSIYEDHVFLSIQLPYIFWLEHLIHLHLKLLKYIVFIAILYLPILPSLFLLLLKADP